MRSSGNGRCSGRADFLTQFLLLLHAARRENNNNNLVEIEPARQHQTDCYDASDFVFSALRVSRSAFLRMCALLLNNFSKRRIANGENPPQKRKKENASARRRRSRRWNRSAQNKINREKKIVKPFTRSLCCGGRWLCCRRYAALFGCVRSASFFQPRGIASAREPLVLFTRSSEQRSVMFSAFARSAGFSCVDLCCCSRRNKQKKPGVSAGHKGETGIRAQPPLRLRFYRL